MQITELTYCTVIGIPPQVSHFRCWCGTFTAQNLLLCETGNAPVPGKHIPSGKQESSCYNPKKPQNIPVKSPWEEGRSIWKLQRAKCG